MRSFAAILAAAFFAAAPAHALTLAQGTMETRIAGLLDSTSTSGAQTDLTASWGYFFRDNVQAGVRGLFYNDDDITMYGAGGFIEYNVDTGSEDWMPFVGAGLDYVYGDVDGGDSRSAAVFELSAGAMYFLAPNVALSGALVGQFATDEIFPDDEELQSDDISLQIAVRFYY